MVDLYDIKKALASNSGSIIGEKEAHKASILIPLVQTDEGLSILFEERSLKLNSQPGDICFPGGRIESSDASPQEAAARETSEELGISAESIEIIGELGKFIPSMQLIVYPFVGILRHSEFSINKFEVESVFTVPLTYLLKAKPEKYLVSLEPKPGNDFPYDRVAKGKAYQWRKRYITELFYQYKDRSIWGMTAKILDHFLALIKE
ncbi:MAG: NUDIX hydrolase [Tuberibacillus sp.]